jgi:MFS superfamily sulfate permease-like transporter
VSKRLDLASLKGDLAGGATSAVLTVPVSMGVQVLALLPLGDQYISVAILAGLYSAIFLPLTVLLLGDRNALMYARAAWWRSCSPPSSPEGWLPPVPRRSF